MDWKLELVQVPVADIDRAIDFYVDKLGFVARRVEGDLQRFKEFIESRPRETGAWRGEIHGAKVEERPANESSQQ